MTPELPLPRVIVTRHMIGVCHMQVCVVPDATDEEILTVCNRENPSGTKNGWGVVIRTFDQLHDFWPVKLIGPVTCSGHPGRQHFMVSC